MLYLAHKTRPCRIATNSKQRMFMKKIIVLITISMSISTGCSIFNYKPNITDTQKSNAERISYLNSLPCCISPENMVKEPLTSNTTNFTMEENKFASNFNNFKSHYKLFSLSELPNKSYYQLITYTQEADNTPTLLFLPEIYLLDSDFQILGKSNFNKIEYERWSIRGSTNFKYYFRIDKNTLPNQDYVLIISSPVPYGEKASYSRSYNSSYTNMIGSQAYTITEPKTDSINFQTSPSGVITIESLGFMGKPLSDSAYIF